MHFGIRCCSVFFLSQAPQTMGQVLDSSTATAISLDITSHMDSNTLGDRLVLEIEQNTYSQREMEVYFMLKSVSFFNEHAIQKVGKHNWDQALDEFAADMVILIETKRLGRYQPNMDKIENLVRTAEKKVNASPKLRLLKQSLDVNRKVINSKMAELIQIDEFKKLKGTAKDSSWQHSLQEKYVIRRYQGAEFHRDISANSENK